jgi:hypothetical protein
VLLDLALSADEAAVPIALAHSTEAVLVHSTEAVRRAVRRLGRRPTEGHRHCGRRCGTGWPVGGDFAKGIVLPLRACEFLLRHGPGILCEFVGRGTISTQQRGGAAVSALSRDQARP